MATLQEKAGSQTSATPKKIMKTDHENLHLSRDHHILKYRRLAEIDAKLELERKRLEEESEKESKELEKAGMEDNAKTATQEEV